ncbi:MAG: protein kinase [Polyangiaceae bacterium]
MGNVTFSGTKRFKVLRKLGEGGMGAVYECHDVETQSKVALKTLLFADAVTLLRFKDEFRQFQHVSHPNLVSLGELVEEDGLWFFTMELIRGTDFVSHVRVDQEYAKAESATANTVAVGRAVRGSARGSGSANVDHVSLRDALGQLAKGLICLHEAGKVHRDVKPSNVLVADDGRVVVLDFGIAMDMSRREQLTRSSILGTPAYMAPEQAAGVPVTGAADWYAVGVVLYESLSGRLPHEGTLLRVLDEKQWRTPVDPREHVPQAPEDLSRLAMQLLSIRPEDRIGGREVLDRLGVKQSARAIPIQSLITRTDTTATAFVGREQELGQLDLGFKDVQDKRAAVAMYVQGESGVGKSILVGRFTERLRVADPDAVILAGACYEHEAVPYKAVDGVVDALSRYLSRIPAKSAAALLPRHPTALAQAFPVLWRVEAFAECPRPRVEIDPIEQRTRVFAALRELLQRLAERHPLVLCIDDLQWADADSLALLGEILRPPDSPALLLVATVRNEGNLPGFRLPTGPVALPTGGRVIEVGRLSEDDSRELVETLARRVGSASGVDVDTIIREAQGHPLFLNELVRYHSGNVIEGSTRPVALEEALWARIEALDESSRRLLEVVALAPAAMMQATATRAADIEGAEATKHVKRLKAAHLVRTTGGTRGTDLIEPYHGRVGDAVRSNLDAAARRALHRRIALVMETSGLQEAEKLAVHWREAGDLQRAADFAQKAAERADLALAFDRAANYFRMALDLAAPEGKERRTLLVHWGNALANGGRSQEAAEAFRSAAEGATPVEARELARRSAENLLRSGHIDDGLSELRRVLEAVNLSYPETTRSVIASLLWSKTKLGLRGLSFDPKLESRIAPDVLARIDACWAATTGLWVVDQLRGVEFLYRHLLMAFDAREPTRVVRGLAFHAIATVAMGAKARPTSRKILELAHARSNELGTPYTKALLAQAEGTVGYLVGDWNHALEHGRVAIDLLRNTCRGVAWELATTRQLLFWSLAFTGKLQELSGLSGSNLRETLEAGDHYAAMSIRSGLPNVVWLMEDDPTRARLEADAAIAVWSKAGVFLQHLMDLVAQVNIDLYQGATGKAWERVRTARKSLDEAGILRVEFNRILFLDVEGRAALASAQAAPPAERKPYVEVAHRAAKALSSENVPWARALAAPMRAGLAKLEGNVDAAKKAAAVAIAALRESQLHLYASAVALVADVPGEEEARRLFERELVRHPAILARIFFPAW